MDMLTTVGFAIAGFIMILLTIFFVGFKSKIPDTETVLETERIKYEQWNNDIPRLIIKHYASVYETDGMPQIQTVMLNGRAKYKISNLWMPVTYHTWIEHGTGFLRDLEFHWYGKVILKGVDFWIKGVGALRINGVIPMNETGKNVTESQLTNYLAESLLLGIFDFSQKMIQWDIVDENTLILTVPSSNVESEGKHIIKVRFESSSGRIKHVSAERFRGQFEKKRTGWSLQVKKWEKKQGMWVPEYHAKWEDQKKPWCRYAINGVYINADPQVVKDVINKIPTSKYKSEIKVRNRNKNRTKK